MPPRRRTSQRSDTGLKLRRADRIQRTIYVPSEESRHGELQQMSPFVFSQSTAIRSPKIFTDEIVVDCGDVTIQSEPKSRDGTMVIASDLTACLIVNDNIELINLRNARDLAAATWSTEQSIRANLREIEDRSRHGDEPRMVSISRGPRTISRSAFSKISRP